jgi:argininosuccinate synthase
VLEDPTAVVDVERVLAAVSDRFAVSGDGTPGGDSVEVAFAGGVPVAVGGESMPLLELVHVLNHQYRRAPWAWDLIVENRFTGIKSRGLYINPAAKVLQLAADALARSCFHKPLYDQYVALGNRYGEILYRGEFFSDQRLVVEATARALMARMNGTVTVQLSPTPYASRIVAEGSIFRESLATFEASEYRHADAQGFINLTWLSSIGRTFSDPHHEIAMEAKQRAASDVYTDQRLPDGGLVPTAV